MCEGFKKPRIRLYDLFGNYPLKSYKGYKAEENIIQCSFGGQSDTYISVGDEKGYLHIWNIYNGEEKILEKKIHDKVINYITFHPKNNNYLFTCSDDGSIKLFIPENIAENKNLL